jgi:hypothetical protein
MSTDGSMNGAGTDDPHWGAAWLFFAAMVLTLIGITHLVTGLTAASTSFDVWSDVPDDYLFSQKPTWWAWVHIGLGLLLLIVAAFGLFSGKKWARPLALVLLVLSGITAIVWIPYLPFWSAPVLILDAAAIWMLATNHDTA